MHRSDPRRLERPFEIRVEPHGNTALLVLLGAFDLSAAKEFEEGFGQALSAHPEEIILDLRDVDFMDSTALRLVLEAWELSRQDGFDFALVPAQGAVRRLLEQTRLDQTLPMIEGTPDSGFKGSRAAARNGDAAGQAGVDGTG